ncbi:MAG: CRTAC1 family protein [Planctomycetes bacterium]|nr:CRTAC1 family protein [Planctomycetota bacterium]
MAPALLALLPLLLLALPPRAAGAVAQDGAAPITLVDEAAARGVTALLHCGDPVKRRYLLECIGCGCALFDKDGDGDLDLFLVDAGTIGPPPDLPEGADPLAVDWKPRKDGQCRLYENDGAGRFRDVTEASGAGIRVFGQGVTAADYDGDGDLDLYVTCWGPNRLLQNDGSGRFTDVTRGTGVGDPHWSVGAAFFDADGDDDLDLYVGNYLAMAIARDPDCWRKVDCPFLDVPAACGPKGMVPETDSFFRNKGDGDFRDMSEKAGIHDHEPRYALGVVAFDHDQDGDVDVYVGNDSRANSLWDNDGKGRFFDLGDLSGAAVNRDGVAQASMGVACGDLDGDGLFDLAVTNFSHDDNTVYRNEGGGNFADITARHPFGSKAYLSLGWGTEFVDFDGDGALDLFVANGHVYPEADVRAPELSWKQQNRVYQQVNGILRDVTDTAGSGLQRKASFRGAAFGDVDGDRDVDVVVMAMDEPPALLINQGDGRDALLLELRQPTGMNRFAIGARAVATVGGKRLARQVRAGGSFASMSDLRLHFGLGGAPRIDRLEVTWPDGTRQEFGDVAGGRTARLVKGGAIETVAAPSAPSASDAGGGR